MAASFPVLADFALTAASTLAKCAEAAPGFLLESLLLELL